MHMHRNIYVFYVFYSDLPDMKFSFLYDPTFLLFFLPSSSCDTQWQSYFVTEGTASQYWPKALCVCVCVFKAGVRLSFEAVSGDHVPGR